LNGSRLIVASDYTATDGSVVGLTTNAINGDVLECVAYMAFNLGSVNSAAGNFTVGGDLTVSGTSNVGVVTGGTYYGDGSNLTGITAGATLSAGSGAQRLVVTSLTTGTMTAAATDADLAWNSSTNTLSATNITGDVTGDVTGTAGGLSGSPNITINNLVGVAATFSGVVTYEDVTNVDSIGIVTARGGFEIGAAGVGGTISAVGNAEFVGIITAQSDVSIADKIIHTGDTNTAIRFPAVDTFTVETAGTERVRVSSAGSFGVGTNIPTMRLSVNNPGTQQIQYGASNSSGGYLGSTVASQFLLSGGAHYNTTNAWTAVATEAADINTYYGNIYFHSNTGLTNGNTFTPTERMKIDSSGDVTITDGDLVIGTAGHGIDFSAQTATSATGATTTAEILDGYEEGTWTPTLMGHISGTGTLTHYGAYYTKVGNIVHFECYIVCTGLGTISGDIRVGGLPFTVNAAYHNVNFSAAESLSITAGESLTGFCAVNTDYLKVMIWNATTGTMYLTSGEFTASGGFIASGSYFDYS